MQFGANGWTPSGSGVVGELERSNKLGIGEHSVQ